MVQVRVCGPRDRPPQSDGATIINTCSNARTWSVGLSPFVLGPVKLYSGLSARNVENAWQYSKVYEEHVGPDGNPSPAYFVWARRGWDAARGRRYPMGKGRKPLYAWWDGERLDYVTARKRIYCPLYAAAVRCTDAFATLKQVCGRSPVVWLWDFDGYDHAALGMSYDDVVNCPDRKMGHAFVLAMLLDGYKAWKTSPRR